MGFQTYMYVCMYVYMAVHMAVHVCVLHIFAAHAGLWGALSTSVVQVVFPLNNFDLRKKKMGKGKGWVNGEHFFRDEQ